MQAEVVVAMAAYNGARYLAESLDSVLKQSYGNFELVIVDDGSKDATPAILADYARRDTRVRVLTNESNQGLIASRNRAIVASDAPLIALFDADDIMHPHRLERQVAFLKAHPDHVLCGTSTLKFKGRPWRSWLKRRRHAVNDARFRVELMRNSPVANPSTLFRRSVMPEVPYRQDRPHAEDYQLWVDLLVHGKAAILPDILLYYRLHAGQVSQVHREAQRATANTIRLSLLARLGFRLDATDEATYLSIMAGAMQPGFRVERVQPLIDDLIAQCRSLRCLDVDMWQSLLLMQAERLR